MGVVDTPFAAASLFGNAVARKGLIADLILAAENSYPLRCRATPLPPDLKMSFRSGSGGSCRSGPANSGTSFLSGRYKTNGWSFAVDLAIF